MLTVKDLNVGYGKAHIIKDVSIQVNRGEITLLMGVNESGKSTLLKAIAALVKPWSGEIDYYTNGGEMSLIGKKPHSLVGKGIVYIPDERSVFPELTVVENLKIGSYRKESREKFNQLLDRVYKIFPKLEERQNQYGGTLSGGEKQMLAVGRALMADPEFLLMDEPSLGLAPIIVKNLFENIERLNTEYGLTILLTEQNFKQSIKIGDRGYMIVDGEVRFEGDDEELKDSEMVRKHYLGI